MGRGLNIFFFFVFILTSRLTLFIFVIQLCGWVKNVGEDFLDHNTVMGDSIKTSQDFLYSHQELDSDRQVRYPICEFNNWLSSTMFSFRGQEVGARVDVGMKRKGFFFWRTWHGSPCSVSIQYSFPPKQKKCTSLENFSTWSFKVMVDSHLCYSSVGTWRQNSQSP